MDGKDIDLPFLPAAHTELITAIARISAPSFVWNARFSIRPRFCS